MILKEKTLKENSGSFYQQLGNEAEKQMSFYLKRHFAKAENYYVLNDLKIHYEGENCQIDHIVICESGVYIIESKSCVGEIKYDEQDQWIRYTKKGRFGMQSPVEQAELQKQLLKKYLAKSTENGEILGTLLGMKEGYGARNFQKIIAISDTTIIEHPKKPNQFVMKADKVCDFIKNFEKDTKILKKYNPFKNTVPLKPFQVENTAYFLLNGKTQKEDTKVEPKISAEEEQNKEPDIDVVDVIGNALMRGFFGEEEVEDKEKEKEEPQDTKMEKEENKTPNEDCQHDDHIIYGKYGYYFKCKKCDRNKNINEKCEICNKKMKIRKCKQKFYAVCQNCQKEDLYFENK